MNEHHPDELDARLAGLRRDVEPTRDLWPGIAAAIATSTRAEPTRAESPPLSRSNVLRFKGLRRAGSSRAWQIAASVVLMVASSALTHMLTQRSMQGEILQARQQTVEQMQPVLSAMPASFGYQTPLGAGYSQARAALGEQFEHHLRSLPPAEQARIERSLTDLRRAASEISSMLAEHPSDPLLQELLLSTYQNELGLLTRVNELGATSMGADL